MSGLTKMFNPGQGAVKAASMPDMEDPEVVARRRKRALEATTRGGRQSTILSGESPVYSATSLGN